MNIFDQYGIKEVADVTLYSIHRKKSGGVYYVPALFLDTLKVSSVDKKAENVWAEGGLNNSRLICWDYGKQINVTLEDALCTPASLGLCWGGILGADWRNGKIDHDFGVTWKEKRNVSCISRLEKVRYPNSDKKSSMVSALLPQLQDDLRDEYSNLLLSSSIVDGTVIAGFGQVLNHTYRWQAFVESDIQSVAIVPDRFFDVQGNTYLIDLNSQLIVNDNLEENKFNIIYKINSKNLKNTSISNLIVNRENQNRTEDSNENETLIDENEVVKINNNKAIWTPPQDSQEKMNIDEAQYLCICIDINNEYSAYLSREGRKWYKPKTEIILGQFKDLNLWMRFSGINEMIYFLITKYENDIIEIITTDMEEKENTTLLYKDRNSYEAKKKNGKLWAYINPQTMTPYPDDYWFSQGETYYIKSLTLAPKQGKLSAQKIEIQAGEFPGLYMLVGETYIRSRETGEDERMQLKFPMCKVKSDHSITLEAAGDPTVFNLDLEIANPKNGIMMELISYDVAEKTKINELGEYSIVDGSTEILNE